jgi:hypothetical protein
MFALAQRFSIALISMSLLDALSMTNTVTFREQVSMNAATA